MTLVFCHTIGTDIVIISDSASIEGNRILSRPKCTYFQTVPVALAVWGDIDLDIRALTTREQDAPADVKHYAAGNYIGGNIPSPLGGIADFRARFLCALNNAENVHNGDGTRGKAWLCVGFADGQDTYAYSLECGGGKGTWGRESQIDSWPQVLGDRPSLNEMLLDNNLPLAHVTLAASTSVDDFARLARRMIEQTSANMARRGKRGSIGPPVRKLVLHADGRIEPPCEI